MTGRRVGTLTACPECGGSAEITELVLLDSTDGPVEHARVECAHRHWFLMPSDRLVRLAAPRTSVA